VAFVCVDPLPIPVLAPAVPGAVHLVGPVSGEFQATGTRLPSQSEITVEPNRTLKWPSVAVGLWTVLVFLLFAALAFRIRKIRCVARRAVEAPGDIQHEVARLSDLLTLRQPPTVRVSQEIDTPLVLGFRNPVVLLPVAPFTALPTQDRRMALCHELLHLRRKDLLLAYIPALAERVFFFHPLAHLAVREYQLTREAACDAAVIWELDARPGDYGRLLLALGVSRLPMHLAAAGSPSSYSKLKRRITMLRDVTKFNPRLRTAGWTAVLLAALAITPFTLVARSQDPNSTPQPARPSHPAKVASPTQPGLPSTPVTPQAPAAAGRRGSKRVNYVLFMDEDSTMMSGSSADRSRAASLRKGKEQLLWFRRDGREYVVRDPAVLREVEETFRPLRQIGEEQAKVGAKQAGIGQRQAEIGEQQAAIGQKQAEIGAKQAQIGSRQAAFAARQAASERVDRAELDKERRQLELDMRQLEQEMQALSGEMHAFNKPMDDLNEDMNALSEDMNALSRKMEEASAKAEAQMDALLHRAISSGAATEVK